MVNDVVYCESCMEHITMLCAPATVQFSYLETCGTWNWRRAKLNGGAGYESSICCTTLDVSE